MTFKLDRPRNLSVEVNGDIFHNLHLFYLSLHLNLLCLMIINFLYSILVGQINKVIYLSN